MRLFALMLVIACWSSTSDAAIRDHAPIAGYDAHTDPRRWYSGEIHVTPAAEPAADPTATARALADLAAEALRVGEQVVAQFLLSVCRDDIHRRGPNDNTSSSEQLVGTVRRARSGSDGASGRRRPLATTRRPDPARPAV